MRVSRNQLDEVIERLCDRFPKTFFVFQDRRKPLKVGIHYDLERIVLDKTLGRTLLRLTLSYYVREFGYLKSLKVGADRVDLDGNPAGTVTELQVKQAKADIANNLLRRKRKPPKRDGLSALREAAAKRRQGAGT